MQFRYLLLAMFIVTGCKSTRSNTSRAYDNATDQTAGVLNKFDSSPSTTKYTHIYKREIRDPQQNKVSTYLTVLPKDFVTDKQFLPMTNPVTGETFDYLVLQAEQGKDPAQTKAIEQRLYYLLNIQGTDIGVFLFTLGVSPLDKETATWWSPNGPPMIAIRDIKPYVDDSNAQTTPQDSRTGCDMIMSGRLSKGTYGDPVFTRTDGRSFILTSTVTSALNTAIQWAPLNYKVKLRSNGKITGGFEGDGIDFCSIEHDGQANSGGNSQGNSTGSCQLYDTAGMCISDGATACKACSDPCACTPTPNGTRGTIPYQFVCWRQGNGDPRTRICY